MFACFDARWKQRGANDERIKAANVSRREAGTLLLREVKCHRVDRGMDRAETLEHSEPSALAAGPVSRLRVPWCTNFTPRRSNLTWLMPRTLLNSTSGGLLRAHSIRPQPRSALIISEIPCPRSESSGYKPRKAGPSGVRTFWASRRPRRVGPCTLTPPKEHE